MAGEVSGIAGMMNVAQPQQEDPGQNLMRLVQAAMQIKAQKTAEAKTTLDTMLTMMDRYGITPDENTFNKISKDAGVPLDKIQMLAQTKGGTVPAGGATTQDVTHMGKELQTNGGTTVPQGPSAIPAGTGTVEKGVTAANSAPGPGGTVSGPSWIQQLGDMARQRITQTNATAAMQAHLDQQIVDLKTRALGGDKTAVGALMRLNVIPFDIKQQEWEGMTPEQRQSAVDVAAGNESPAAKEARLSQQSMTLFQSGRFDTVADARQFAEGKTPDHPIKPDLGRFVDEAKFSEELLNLGVKPQDVNELSRKMAMGVPLNQLLPAGVQTVAQQQLALDRQRNDIETQKVGIMSRQETLAERAQTEQEKYHGEELQAQAAQLVREVQKDKDEAFNKRFADMLDATKAGSPLPTDVVQGMVTELAHRSGMTISQVGSIWDYLTIKNNPLFNNPRSLKFRPTSTYEDQLLLNQRIGGDQKLNSGSGSGSGSAGVSPLPPNTSIKINPDALNTMQNYRDQYKKDHGVYPEQDQ